MKQLKDFKIDDTKLHENNSGQYYICSMDLPQDLINELLRQEIEIDTEFEDVFSYIQYVCKIDGDDVQIIIEIERLPEWTIYEHLGLDHEDDNAGELAYKYMLERANEFVVDGFHQTAYLYF